MVRQPPEWVNMILPEHVLAIPSYVPGKPIEEVQRELGIGNVVKMASNENPLGPSPKAIAAARRQLERAHVYPESSAPELREALAARFGLPVSSVILGNGSDEIMQLAAHVFIRPGTEAIIGQNTFSMYRISVQAFGGKIRSVPLEHHRFDLAAVASAVNSNTRVIFLAIPNSPTGTVVSRAAFDDFIKVLPEKGLLLVIDEAYREYVRESDCPYGTDYLGKGLPVLVLRTFSKIYGLAGLRIGYGFSEPWVIELLNRVRPPFNVNAVAQAAAIAALEDVEHVERSLRNTEVGMKFLAEALAALGLEVIPSEANFLTFCLNRDSKQVYDALLPEGIIVRPLASFGMPRCIRVTVGTQEQNERFARALSKVLATK
jgi:histidinol-phosphate aminotransferase